jgi:hypothetical protein
MTKSFLILLLSAFFLPACAQTKSGVQNSYAYFRIFIPGNIPVDESGNALRGTDTIRMIYIETKGTAQLNVQTVQYGNKVYSAAVFEEQNSQVTVGKDFRTNIDKVIRRGKGNRLWRVELSSEGEVKGLPVKNINIKGTLGGKKFVHVLKRETELQPEIRG